MTEPVEQLESLRRRRPRRRCRASGRMPAARHPPVRDERKSAPREIAHPRIVLRAPGQHQPLGMAALDDPLDHRELGLAVGNRGHEEVDAMLGEAAREPADQLADEGVLDAVAVGRQHQPGEAAPPRDQRPRRPVRQVADRARRRLHPLAGGKRDAVAAGERPRHRRDRHAEARREVLERPALARHCPTPVWGLCGQHRAGSAVVRREVRPARNRKTRPTFRSAGSRALRPVIRRQLRLPKSCSSIMNMLMKFR